MADEILAIPSPGDNYVTLSGDSAEGRMLRKKILPMNQGFIHPGDHKTKIFVDKAMAESLIKNFKRLDFPVQVPIVNAKNEHTEDPRDNAGRVTGLDYDDTGVYATIKASKYAEDFGKTILGASAFLHLNYIDTATGERTGPALLHVAATNRPHVNGLGEYENAVKASADIDSETEILFLSEEETSEPDPSIEVDDQTEEEKELKTVEPKTPKEEEIPMTEEEVVAFLKENPDTAKEFLKDNNDIDVEALQGEAEKAAELSAKLDDVTNKLELSGNNVEDLETLATSFVELSQANKALVNDVEALKLSNATYAKRDAENEVESLIRLGKVLPAQKDVMVKLSLSDRETFDALIPENALVQLSETGLTLHEESNSAHYDADIERYKTMARGNKKN